MKRLSILFALTFACAATTGCEKKSDDPSANKPQAVKPAANTGDQAKAQAEAKLAEATDKAEAAVEKATEKVEAKVEKATEKVEAKAEKAAEAVEANVEKAAEKAGATGETVAAKECPSAEAGGCAYGEAVKAQEVKDGVEPSAGSCGNAGCGGCGAVGEVKPVTAEGTLYGAAFTVEENATVPLAKVMASADEFNGKNVRVSASVNKVCKAKGCWFVLQPEAGSEQFVRVTMNHKFFVPTDCEGKSAIVEGVFRKVELPEDARKHLAKDGGDDPKKVTGKAVELTLIASSVQLAN